MSSRLSGRLRRLEQRTPPPDPARAAKIDDLFRRMDRLYAERGDEFIALLLSSSSVPPAAFGPEGVAWREQQIRNHEYAIDLTAAWAQERGIQLPHFTDDSDKEN